jgi:multidrug resistance efflux pump
MAAREPIMTTNQPREAGEGQAGPRRARRITGIAVLATIAVAAAVCRYRIEGRPEASPTSSDAEPEIVAVDRGDVIVVLTENGTLESGDDALVRCQVESFLGLPTGTQPGRPVPSSQLPRPRAAAVASPAPSGPGTSAAGTPSAADQAKAKAKTMDRFAFAKAEPPGSSAVAAGSPAVPPNASGPSPGRAPTPEPAFPSTLPEVRSFQYVVKPYVPLRTESLDAVASAGPPPPPPSILSIVPEGTRVKGGEVVCELDSSAFRRELLAQRARHLRAKGWVDKARSMLEVNKITLREFENGVFPQDVECLRQHIRTCETERGLAERNLAWSRETAGKHFRSRQQVEVDAFTLEKAEIALVDARSMFNRLVNYTGKRVLKAIQAKIEANRADLLSLETSYQLESERLKRIEAMIANCTLRAPRAGMVLHANRSNAWGQVMTQIQEGLTVYPSQPIFRILDPEHIVVRARINESQIARIRTGQPALIRFDAYPERPLRGTVKEITPIPALAGGPISDVHSCFATVRFDASGLETLQLGLSAEVDFLVETRRQVPRIPIESVQYADDDSYVAVPSDDPSGPGWRWKPVELGAIDPAFAEVRSGLKPGDRVLAHSSSLHAPEPESPGRGTDVALAR